MDAIARTEKTFKQNDTAIDKTSIECYDHLSRQISKFVRGDGLDSGSTNGNNKNT